MSIVRPIIQHLQKFHWYFLLYYSEFCISPSWSPPPNFLLTVTLIFDFPDVPISRRYIMTYQNYGSCSLKEKWELVKSTITTHLPVMVSESQILCSLQTDLCSIIMGSWWECHIGSSFALDYFTLTSFRTWSCQKKAFSKHFLIIVLQKLLWRN